MESLKKIVEFNFYKSLDNDNINAEILALHADVHAFWTRQPVKNTLRKVIDSWCHDPTCQFYTKQPMKVDDVNLQYYYRMMAKQKDKGLAEGGFVECIFELWRVRSRIVKARSEIISTGQFSEYTHRFDDFILQMQTSFNSNYIFGLVLE